MAELTINLFCASGMSTSMLVTRMKEAASKKGKDYAISAHSLNDFENLADSTDVALLGPQVKFAVKRLKEAHPDMVILDIPVTLYGTMNGEKTLAMAEEAYQKGKAE